MKSISVSKTFLMSQHIYDLKESLHVHEIKACIMSSLSLHDLHKSSGAKFHFKRFFSHWY